MNYLNVEVAEMFAGALVWFCILDTDQNTAAAAGSLYCCQPAVRAADPAH